MVARGWDGGLLAEARLTGSSWVPQPSPAPPPPPGQPLRTCLLLWLPPPVPLLSHCLGCVSLGSSSVRLSPSLSLSLALSLSVSPLDLCLCLSHSHSWEDSLPRCAHTLCLYSAVTRISPVARTASPSTTHALPPRHLPRGHPTTETPLGPVSPQILTNGLCSTHHLPLCPSHTASENATHSPSQALGE